ncbi:MAG: tRNA (adenosine(37)-N6)-threonylcarbamoyltransferase complex transferase subunit TsaD [Bacteroidota bacterium]
MAVILAIESSCDDTSAAVVRDGLVLSNLTASQDVHKKYGGVVPEHASRAHQQNILPVVSVAIEESGLTVEDIDAVAFTRGPGLIGSLMVGVSFAKGFAMARNLPLIEVDHMMAHVLAHYAEPPFPPFPFLCLTVSGGHTQITLVRSHLDQEIIGRTIDDAAGEAFDKTGKLLGLSYPAGPQIDQLAKTGKPIYEFARPQIENLDFSFSGLKTSILYDLQKRKRADPDFVKRELANICASVQQTIVQILIDKLTTAAVQTGIKHLAIAGGVSANSGLRTALNELAEESGYTVYLPRFEYCTDNAAMIGITGHFKFLAGQFATPEVAPAAKL